MEGVRHEILTAGNPAGRLRSDRGSGDSRLERLSEISLMVLLGHDAGAAQL